MSPEWVHVEVEAVLAIHREVLRAHGGADGVRDHGLLESAVSAPKATIMGQPVFAEGIEVAGAYLFYLCRNHPFIDGNKRTALATCLVFLEANGLLGAETLDVDAWERLVLDIAASRLSRTDATIRLEQLLKRLDG